MSNITFNVSKKWFDLYKAGVKRKEFRAITEHWVMRLWERESKAPVLGWHVETWLQRGSAISDVPLFTDGGKIVPKTFDTVTICLGYPAKDDLDRRITFKFVGISIGFAEAGIGKELMGDERVFVIEMEDM